MIKKGILIIFFAGLITSCEDEKTISSYNPVDWEARGVENSVTDSLKKGTSYLSVYSEIYSQTEHRTHNLTSTVSMRNVDINDTIYIDKAEYFNTEGKPIRIYFDHPIYIAPLETVEIVVDETDIAGGTGANFIFEWSTNEYSPEPLFEGVMISTSGQQGLSFTSKGVRIK
ncbi:DUF3124 domain-containing protein [Christiangramia forsetii]|uniref:Uncharacterized protein n=2 Tax=Christiangramia forsetii TaxID=411153 RepID=A0LXN3_CHRFK|nr:DUF3124 domain-containing protein [Christiangramia forsetii]GGG36385.1 hypothetical protein GCM10011532_20060 [Christiangramia forsetii]CAL65128.1 conserved hypothetical protein [Christiangramia forsetii KT0803]